MPTITAITSFDNSFLPWTSGGLYSADPESFVIQVFPGPDYLTFEGQFTYSGVGPSGTVETIVAGDGFGGEYWRISGADYEANMLAQLFALRMFTALLELMYAGNDFFSGSGDNDTILGYAGNDTLNGLAGADDLSGGAGDDLFFVGAGDTVQELAGEGFDEVRASASFTLGAARVEVLTLTGSAAINGTGNGRANTINGNGGNNILSGLAGADTMTGGLGRDVMRAGGDAARDVFVFKSTAESGTAAAADVVAGFVAGSDVINLSAIDANSQTLQDDAFFFAGTTATAFSVWYSTANGNLRLYIDTSGDLTADMEIKVLGLTGIAGVDFAL